MPEPLDLDSIRERHQEWKALSDAGNTATWAFSEGTAAMLLAGNDVPRLIAEVERQAAALGRVSARHHPELFAGIKACLACSPGMPPQVLIEWPCPTIRALNGEVA